MSPQNITLIIGAGASKDIYHEINTGDELIKEIANRVTDRTSPHNLNLSKELDEQLNLSLEKRVAFLTHLDYYINSVETPSIDEFLNEINTYPEFEKDKEDFLTIGYVMILAHIFGFEGTTTRNIIERDIKVKNQTWLSVLCNYITNKAILNKGGKIDLKLITFNYDRIIEYYLLNKFEHSNEVIDFINKNVHHVYGRAGCLDKLEPKDIGNGNYEINSVFGEYNNKLKEFKEKYRDHIKIIYDKRNDTEDLKKIIENSDQIFVFGYGFDQTNNARLGLQNCHNKKDNFKVNIYSGGSPNYNFNYRRKMNEKVRNIVLEAEIYYQSCFVFLEKCFEALH